MARFYGVLLIIALVAVSGVIAYIGDIVGRRMGRKRLSLFGMRPRHTAIAISVVSGMLITIVTLGVAMLISKNVRDGFLRVAQMRQEVRELLAEQGQLSNTVKALEKRSGELEQERQDALKAYEKQKGEYEKAKQSLDTTDLALKSEQGKLDAAQTRVKTTEDAARRTAGSLTRTRTELRRVQEDIERVRSGAVELIARERTELPVFEARQQLDTVLIPPRLTLPQIRKRLESLVANLDKSVRAAGARPDAGTARAVVIHHVPMRDKSGNLLTDPQGGVRWMPEDQVLASLARDIRQTADVPVSGTENGVIVQAISLVNTHRGEPVPIDFEIFKNDLVFAKGTELGSVTIEAGTSAGEAAESVYLMLSAKVFTPARARIMPHTSPSSGAVIGVTKDPVGSVSFRELISVGERARQIGGRARVTAVAREDAWTIGPLLVDLRVDPGVRADADAIGA